VKPDVAVRISVPADPPTWWPRSCTVALSVRLFGNMMSGQLVVALLVALTGFLVPMPLMALDLLIGLLQACIFTILATVYVGAAIRAAEA
jgi:F-type H+-transporting ATPase subunit a